MRQPNIGFVYGNCISCDILFGFNPHLVPSVRIDGVREPVCESCVGFINAKRADKGLSELIVLRGAYEPSEF